MKQLIDIHSHYAWDVDDGIATQQEAKAALSLAQQQKITKIIATPHLLPGTTTTKDFQRINTRIKELQELGKDYHIDIYSGCEVMLNRDYLTIFDNQQYLTLNDTNYLLVEFNVAQKLPDDQEERLYEINLRHKPIIAHVERYFHHGLDEHIINDWYQQGYVFQINSSSLLGVHGSTIQENAFDLLESGYVFVIANDVHRATGKRSVQLQEVYDLLTKKYENKEIDILMYENPLKIINGEKVYSVKPKKRSKLSWLKRRK